MSVLRTVKIYGYFGDCPDKNLCQHVAISLYQENDCRIDVHLVDFYLNPMTTMPTITDFDWGLYDRDDGSVVLKYVLSDSEVSQSGSVISVTLTDTVLADLSGTYKTECSLFTDPYRFTLFTGIVTIKETNMQL